MPKPKIAGTQMAVNIPSIRWPLNQRYPEMKNEIITPKSKKKSDLLNIFSLLSVSGRKRGNQTSDDRDARRNPNVRDADAL